MKYIITVALTALLLTGCGEKTTNENITPSLVVGNSLEKLVLNDQFGKIHSVQADTKKVIFAFEQDPAHGVNDYLDTKPATYLQDNKAVFVADVSAAPGIIKSMFIMPGLKDFKHDVWIFEHDDIAAPYRVGVDENSIVIAYLDNKKIIAIKEIKPTKEILAQIIEKQEVVK